LAIPGILQVYISRSFILEQPFKKKNRNKKKEFWVLLLRTLKQTKLLF